jgi:cell division protein FtsQ
MIRKLIRILLIIPLLYIVAVPIYLAKSSNAKPCTGIEVIIKDSSDYHFVTQKNLMSLVNNGSARIVGRPAGEISVADIENRINVLRELKVAEAYLTIDQKLKIYVDQRDPVMRIMPESGGDYFLDEDGVIVRRRNLYNPRLHIVRGNVSISQSMLNGVSIFDTSIKRTILRDIYYLVEYINDDDFWSAQVDQIFVDKDDQIDLIPRVGNHVIHLGTAENYEGKLRNLQAFYEKVLPEVGWNKYSVINLEYKDQIVCKRR